MATVEDRLKELRRKRRRTQQQQQLRQGVPVTGAQDRALSNPGFRQEPANNGRDSQNLIAGATQASERRGARQEEIDSSSQQAGEAAAQRTAQREASGEELPGLTQEGFRERFGDSIRNAPTQPRGRNETLRGLNQTGFDLDSAEVRARRAAGEANPVGSGELALREGNQIPDALRSLESLRERNQDFRFASEVGQFGEPVFDNDSIERLQEVQENDNESLRGGFGISQPPDISPDQRISDRLALGLISEEDARQQRQRLTDRETIQSDNLRTAVEARGSGQGGGQGSAGSNVLIPRTDENGQPVTGPQGQQEFRLNPNATQEDINEFASTFSPRLQSLGPELGFENSEAAVGALGDFIANSRQRSNGNETVSQETLFDTFTLGRAISQAGDINAPNDFQTGISNLAEFIATEDSTAFGFGANAGTIGGTSVSVNDIPDNIRRELNANRQQIKEQMQGRLDTSVGQQFNSKLVGGFADAAKDFEGTLSDASNQIGRFSGRRGANFIPQSTVDEFKPLLSDFRKDANELSTRISNGDQDVTADEIQAIDARFQAIQERLAENRRVRNALGIAPEDLRN